MRREYFTLEVSNVAHDEGGEPGLPVLGVTFEGSADALHERLANATGDLLDADETDVTFRLQDSPENDDAAGVVAITDRLTGEYILEFNAEAGTILEFIAAARQYGESTDDDAGYRVVIAAEDEELVAYEKRTLLVYASDGELLRGHSLIPSGVEI